MKHRCVAIVASLFTSTVLMGGSLEQGPPARPCFRDFMGVNGHTVQFRPQLYQSIATLVRDYHPVEWDLGTNSAFQPPFPLARNGVDWSQVYSSWQHENWRTDVSLMFETLPRERWTDLASDSRAYAERFARAFGPSGSRRLVDSVEVGNEPGKFSDADYRVVFENMARGLKSGDPKLKVVTCALDTGKSHDYAKSVDCLIGLEPLYDILNLHTYAQLAGWPTWQRSFPEDPRLKDYLPDVRRLCEWRDLHAPGKEVWITEFGYDASSSTPDPNTEFKEWKGVTEEQQAQWLVRSWLVFASLDVQRAYLYFFNDDDAPKLHGSSGLTRRFKPKPAFYAAAHLQRCLGDFRFSRIVTDRPGQALVLEFVHGRDAHRRAWVAWSPTGSHRAGRFELPSHDGLIEKAERMPLTENENSRVEVSPNAREVPLSESPLYLFLRPE